MARASRSLRPPNPRTSPKPPAHASGSGHAYTSAESDAIREELGDFVLVNTNTSAVNPRMGTILDYVASLDSVGFDLVADGAYAPR